MSVLISFSNCKFVFRFGVPEVWRLVDFLEFLHEIDNSITQAIFSYITTDIWSILWFWFTIALYCSVRLFCIKIISITSNILVPIWFSLVRFPLSHFFKWTERFSTIRSVIETIVDSSFATTLYWCILRSVSTKPGLFPIRLFNRSHSLAMTLGLPVLFSHLYMFLTRSSTYWMLEVRIIIQVSLCLYIC